MKQITITVPDNCELKQDGNTYTILEKEKKFTYEDVARSLFSKSYHYIDNNGKIHTEPVEDYHIIESNNCTSRRQAEKLLAINKLMNVAKYLNGDWQPDWNCINEPKYAICYSNKHGSIYIDVTYSTQISILFFKSKELAQQAIKILGEETIKLALCTDY